MHQQPADLMLFLRQAHKLFEHMLRPVCQTYGLSMIEAAIVSFLRNNPGKDTAGEIVNLRLLSKSNVSQAVDSLARRGLLVRTPDPIDRRRIHLHLTQAAHPLTLAVDAIRLQHAEQILQGFSPEERLQFADMLQRMTDNTRIPLEEDDL